MSDERESDAPPPPTNPPGAAPGKVLTPAAKRALEEAAADTVAGEHGGPSGPEPTRYGDWERNGIASDF